MSTVEQPRLSDLFRRLADDPELLVEYGRRPAETLAAAGLTEAQIAAVERGGVEALRVTLADELADELAVNGVPLPRMSVETPSPPPPPGPDKPKPKPKPRPKPGPKR